MSKKIGILVEFNYEDLEVVNNNLYYGMPSLISVHQVWYPLLRFREEGMITCTIGPEQGKDYLSKKGYPCKADVGIDSVKAEVYLFNIDNTDISTLMVSL